MPKRFPIIAAVITFAAGCAYAQKSDALRHYQPEREVSGVIRNWGNNEFAALLKLWEQGFRKYHSAVHFEDKLMGPASAMAGVYTGVADLSWTGHELWKEESMAFEWVFQYKPQGVEVVTSSLDVHDHGAALVVFVHKDNPLAKLSVVQLDAVFGSEHKRGARNIRTWGDMGLAGEWADKPIHPYGYDAETEAGFFFRRTVLNDSYKWNCDLKHFNNRQRADGSIEDAGPQVTNALASDRYGMAYSKFRYANPSVKALALSVMDGGPSIAPSKDNVRHRTYPLTRVMMVYLNRAPRQPVEPKVREFLRYILSQEGQNEVAREGGYVPLTANIAAEQSRKVE